MSNKPTTTIRQLTPDERKKLDDEVNECAGEIFEDAKKRTRELPQPPAGVRGALVRAGRAVKASAAFVGGLFTRSNFEAACAASGAFARLALRYGADEVRAALLRRIQRTVGGVIGGGSTTGNADCKTSNR